MTLTAVPTTDPGLSLQSTLAASSARPELGAKSPHHPISCPGPLAYHDDNRFACAHSEVAGDDIRTRHCVDHSIALLLIELAKTWPA